MKRLEIAHLLEELRVTAASALRTLEAELRRRGVTVKPSPAVENILRQRETRKGSHNG